MRRQTPNANLAPRTNPSPWSHVSRFTDPLHYLCYLLFKLPVSRFLSAFGLGLSVFLLAALCVSAQPASTNAPPATNAPSLFRSDDDGWFDVSSFLEQKYGFLPIVIPITEPAVGYGAAGALAFLSKPIAGTQDGLGRPNISLVGGLGTGNGTAGAFAADVRHW